MSWEELHERWRLIRRVTTHSVGVFPWRFWGTTVNAYTYDYDGYQTAFDTTGTSNDAAYAYDADKRRIGKVVDSITTKYFLDPDTSGRKQRAGSADVIADYDVDNALVATYVTPGLDSNLSQTRSGSTYYYMRDGLGSIRNVVDSSEATQNTYDYYAFGKELGTWTQNVTNRYTYTAREYDPESKQYYYRARYYSGDGSFRRRDSLSPRGYTYVLSSPVVLIDPSGEIVDDVKITDGKIHVTIRVLLSPGDNMTRDDLVVAAPLIRSAIKNLAVSQP